MTKSSKPIKDKPSNNSIHVDGDVSNSVLIEGNNNEVSFQIGKKSKTEHLEQFDREIFNKLLKILEESDLIVFLRVHDLMGGYGNDILLTMDKFQYFCSEPKNIFIDKKLKIIQSQLHQSIIELKNYLGEHGTYSDTNPDRNFIMSSHGIRHDWREGFPENERKEISKALDERTDAIIAKYTKLIDAAKNMGL